MQGVQLTHSPERGVIFTNFSLVLQRISQAQAGAYMCESSNRVGKGRSEDIVLDVKCKLLSCQRNFVWPQYFVHSSVYRVSHCCGANSAQSNQQTVFL